MGRKAKPNAGGKSATPGKKKPVEELTVKLRGAIRDAVEAFTRDYPGMSAAAYVSLATQEKLITDGYLVRPKRPATDSDISSGLPSNP